jgi:hypothetical protein
MTAQNHLLAGLLWRQADTALTLVNCAPVSCLTLSRQHYPLCRLCRLVPPVR